MKLSGLLCVAALMLGAVTPAWADGAIARAEDGKSGISYNVRGQRAAEERAMEECGRRCRIIGTFHNSCAALANSPRGAYGWASREGRRRAEEAAIEICRREGGRECRVALSGCDDRG